MLRWLHRHFLRWPTRNQFTQIWNMGPLEGATLILPFCGPVWIVYDLVHAQIAYGLVVGIPIWLFLCLVANAVLLHQPDEYQRAGGPWRRDWEPPGREGRSHD